MNKTSDSVSDLASSFVATVESALSELQTEISKRNADITKLDSYIYDDRLDRSLDIPVGHDNTPVNWLKRSVEIHRDQFMGRGFVMVSTYDSSDPSTAEDATDKKRIKIENAMKKQRAESRRRFADAIVRDNGGFSLFKDVAENAGAVGFSVIKTWYDEKNKVYKMVPIESVENFYALWSEDNFREADLYAFVYQISPQKAMDDFGLSEDDITTSILGEPDHGLSKATTGYQSAQKMVTVREITGKVPGWGSKDGKEVRVVKGKENNINALIVGKKVVRLIDDEKKLPRYYIYPNKKVRRRPWGTADVTDTMIQLNLSYIETYSDWRTVGNKVNFPKFKMYNFSPSAQLPKMEPRQTQGIPMAEGQDMQRLDTGDANTVDFKAQLDETKEQYVREAGISRVLFDDPTLNLNSNQALMTSMKPTTDIAEAKKTLWAPILAQMFKDALEVVAEFEEDVRDLIDEDWHYEVKWPSVMQREDPVFQQMLINRWNSNTISLQTFLEEQGETKEEIDRIRDEMEDPLTAALLSHQAALLAQGIIAPAGPPEPKVNLSLRGDLTPYQEANVAHKYGMNEGPFPPTAGPQGGQGLIAQENADNQDFLTDDAFNGGTPIQRGPEGEVVGGGAYGGTDSPPVATPAQNQEGQQPTSQPGSGATPVSPQGKINQTNQQSGK